MKPSSDNLLGAEFMDNNSILTFTERQIYYTEIQPTRILGKITGGPFVLATTSKHFIFAVVQTETAPFMDNFVLVYQLGSGVFLNSLEFNSRILKLLCQQNLLYVSLPNTIEVINTGNFHRIATIERINQNGMISATNKFLCYPDDSIPGTITILSVPGYSTIKQISCHQDPIITFSLSDDSSFLTTASKKGTIIRKFDIKTGKKIIEMRRGFRNSTVTSVFSDENYTIACSPTTLHIFINEQHITVPLTSHPLDCRVIDDTIALVTNDSLLSFFKVDLSTNTAQLITQKKLIFAAPRRFKQKRISI